MFSLRFTVFLLFVLIIPFVLRLKYGEHLEIYPAVMLPSGVDKLWNINNQVEIGYTSFAGKDKNGNWIGLNNIRLISPIPDQYLPVIPIDNDTVSDIAGSRFLQILNRFGIQRHNKSRVETDLLEINSWIKRQLLHQNFDTLQIKKIQHKIIISSKNGTIVKDHYNERIIQLVRQN